MIFGRPSVARSVSSCIALFALAFFAACKCPQAKSPAPLGTPVVQGGTGAAPIVRGRAGFYAPPASGLPGLAQLDLEVTENARPFKARRMEVWWTSAGESGPVYTAAPNASYTKVDTTQPVWEVDNIAAEWDYTKTVQWFRIKVVVYGAPDGTYPNGPNLTGLLGPPPLEIEWKWNAADPGSMIPPEPPIVWHQLTYNP